MTDKELVERYPFLKVDPEYNYIDKPEELYSEEDLYIPKGWRDLFLKCCEELREALVKLDMLDKFKIDQLKEKYGSMRIYTNISNPIINSIIERYTIISEFTCCVCGKLATKETTGWICPYCDDCIKNVKSDKIRPLSEYVRMTKFDDDKSHKQYYTVHNLPYNADNENNYIINAKDETVTIPMIWLDRFYIKEYLNNANINEKSVIQISETLEKLLKK